jgi:hypothetical protein
VNFQGTTAQGEGGRKHVGGEIDSVGDVIVNTCYIEARASEGIVEREVINA